MSRARPRRAAARRTRTPDPITEPSAPSSDGDDDLANETMSDAKPQQGGDMKNIAVPAMTLKAKPTRRSTRTRRAPSKLRANDGQAGRTTRRRLSGASTTSAADADDGNSSDQDTKDGKTDDDWASEAPSDSKELDDAGSDINSAEVRETEPSTTRENSDSNAKPTETVLAVGGPLESIPEEKSSENILDSAGARERVIGADRSNLGKIEGGNASSKDASIINLKLVKDQKVKEETSTQLINNSQRKYSEVSDSSYKDVPIVSLRPTKDKKEKEDILKKDQIIDGDLQKMDILSTKTDASNHKDGDKHETISNPNKSGSAQTAHKMEDSIHTNVKIKPSLPMTTGRGNMSALLTTEKSNSPSQAKTHVKNESPTTKVTTSLNNPPSAIKVTTTVKNESSTTKVTTSPKNTPLTAKITTPVKNDPSLAKVTTPPNNPPSATKMTSPAKDPSPVTKVKSPVKKLASTSNITSPVKNLPSATKVTSPVKSSPGATKVTSPPKNSPSAAKSANLAKNSSSANHASHHEFPIQIVKTELKTESKKAVKTEVETKVITTHKAEVKTEIDTQSKIEEKAEVNLQVKTEFNSSVSNNVPHNQVNGPQSKDDAIVSASPRQTAVQQGHEHETSSSTQQPMKYSFQTNQTLCPSKQDLSSMDIDASNSTSKQDPSSMGGAAANSTCAATNSVNSENDSIDDKARGRSALHLSGNSHSTSHPSSGAGAVSNTTSHNSNSPRGQKRHRDAADSTSNDHRQKSSRENGTGALTKADQRFHQPQPQPKPQPQSAKKSTENEAASESLRGLSPERIKLAIYSAGSKVHRGRGFERIFSEYWENLSLFLSGGHESVDAKRFRKTIHSFLKTKRLRRLHNKLIMVLMERSVSQSATLREIGGSIPSTLRKRIRFTSETELESNTKAKALKDRRKRGPDKKNIVTTPAVKLLDARTAYTPLYSSTLGLTPIESRSEVSTASIPGAIVIDPLVREAVQAQGMRVTESAVWLFIVAMQAYTKSLLKETISGKEALQNKFLPPLPSAKDRLPISEKADSTHPDRTISAGGNMPRDSKNGKCITAFDIMNLCTRMSIGSSGGSSCRMAFERSIYATFRGGSDAVREGGFEDVHRFITEGIESSAGRFSNAEAIESSNIEAVTSSRHKPPARNASNRTKQVTTNEAPKDTAQQFAVPLPKQEKAQKETKAKPKAKPQSQQRRAAPQRVAVGGLGRGAKNLAALMARTKSSGPSSSTSGTAGGTSGAKPSGNAAPAPGNAPSASNSNVDRVSNDNVNSSNANDPGTQSVSDVSGSEKAENSAVAKDEKKQQVAAPRRGKGKNFGKGFGAKNLAVMRARIMTTNKTQDDKKAGNDQQSTTTGSNQPPPPA